MCGGGIDGKFPMRLRSFQDCTPAVVIPLCLFVVGSFGVALVMVMVCVCIGYVNVGRIVTWDLRRVDLLGGLLMPKGRFVYS